MSDNIMNSCDLCGSTVNLSTISIERGALCSNCENINTTNACTLPIKEIEIFEENNGNFAKALEEAGFPMEKQQDLLYIKFKLVHANTNKNKDHFLTHELKNSQNTPILKLVNWNHKEPNIGVIYASRFVESTDPNESDYLECFCAISKLKYESYANEIVKRYNNSTLSFSMETFFAKAECSQCKKVFDGPENSYCNHLKSRFTAGSKTARILHGLVFAGCAVADTPADINAEALAMASNTNEEVNIVSDKTYTQAEVDSMIEDAVAKAIKASELSKENEGLKTRLDELTQAVTELTDNLSKAHESLKATEASLADLSTQKETIAKEYTEFKVNVQRAELVRARLAELTSSGYPVPEKDSDQFKALEATLSTIDDNAFAVIRELSTQLKQSASANTNTNENSNPEGEHSNENELPPLTGSTQASTGETTRRELIREILSRKR